MTDAADATLREKDRVVLRCISEGATDTTAIREKTTLSNRDVHYCFDKLEEGGLIETHTPDGRVTRVINGQKQNFRAPRQAQLTKRGKQHLSKSDQPETVLYDMDREEMIERIRELEGEVSDLWEALDTFRKQVRREL